MKTRLFSIIMAAAMLLCLTACNADLDDRGEETAETASARETETAQETVSETSSDTEETSTETTVETVEQPAGPLAYTVERVDRSVSNESGETVLKLYYDLVTVEGNSAAAEQINAALRSAQEASLAMSEESWFMGGDEEAFMENFPMAGPEQPFLDTVDAVVTYNDGKYFSVELKTEWFGGGVHSIGYRGLVFDAETGAQLGLDELIPDCLTQMADIIWNFYVEKGAAEQVAYDYIYSQLSYDDFSYCISESGEITVLTESYAMGFPGYASAWEIPTGMYVESLGQTIASEEEFVQAILGQWRRYDDEEDATVFVYFGEDGTAAAAIGYGTVGGFAGGGTGTWSLESFSGDGHGSAYIEVIWDSDGGETYSGTVEITADSISPRLDSVGGNLPLVTGRYSSYPWYYVE